MRTNAILLTIGAGLLLFNESSDFHNRQDPAPIVHTIASAYRNLTDIFTDGQLVRDKCSNSIFKPIPIRTAPPTASTLLSKKCPNFLPINTPRYDIVNVTRPIIITALATVAVISEIVTPTASASILVATDRTNNMKIFAPHQLSNRYHLSPEFRV